jgi:hypothetical protein
LDGNGCGGCSGCRVGTEEVGLEVLGSLRLVVVPSTDEGDEDSWCWPRRWVVVRRCRRRRIRFVHVKKSNKNGHPGPLLLVVVALVVVLVLLVVVLVP